MYSGKYESAESELDMGSNKYKVQQVFMTKYDGIKRYEEIKEKIEKEEEPTDKDLEENSLTANMELVFLPLMRNEKSEEEVTKDVFELAIKIPDEDKKEAVIGSLLGFSDNYVMDEYINKLKEVIRMTKIGTSLFEEGFEEGEKELTIKILNRRFGRRLTEELKDRIREAGKKTKDYIGNNLLEITIEELKEILK
ncbi:MULTISPECIES: hypothetical protein [Petrotoga]|nr:MULTISPECIES: hypothetical protein [Petrotoga]